MNQNEIDTIVEAIAARVRERLAGSASSCSASSSSCAACGECASKRESDTRDIISLGAVRVAAGPRIGEVPADLARYIDHTLLKPEATKEQLRELCEEARRYSFRTVCVNSSNVRFCKSLLTGSSVMVIAVVGFPLGAMSTGAKAFEAREAIRDGAEEIDMVINIGDLKSGNFGVVEEDIRKVVEASRPKPVKVILETGQLDYNEKVVACTLAKAAGAHFVKTSTGFGPGGATAEDVSLMKEIVGGDMEVKASGGIRSREDALRMIQAGATRVGASASIAIVVGKKSASSDKY